jgi:hypothetical protein
MSGRPKVVAPSPVPWRVLIALKREVFALREAVAAARLTHPVGVVPDASGARSPGWSTVASEVAISHRSARYGWRLLCAAPPPVKEFEAEDGLFDAVPDSADQVAPYPFVVQM